MEIKHVAVWVGKQFMSHGCGLLIGLIQREFEGIHLSNRLVYGSEVVHFRRMAFSRSLMRSERRCNFCFVSRLSGNKSQRRIIAMRPVFSLYLSAFASLIGPFQAAELISISSSPNHDRLSPVNFNWSWWFKSIWETDPCVSRVR